MGFKHFPIFDRMTSYNLLYNVKRIVVKCFLGLEIYLKDIQYLCIILRIIGSFLLCFIRQGIVINLYYFFFLSKSFQAVLSV